MALYTVTIRHPNGNAGLITVRNAADIYGGQVGVLRNGTVFTGDLDFRENGDIWAKITVNPIEPALEGYYCAVKYGPKIFGQWTPVSAPPIPETDKFARLFHCSQTSVTGYKTYMHWRFGNTNSGIGLPSCFKYPFAKETYLRPTREMEEWWFGLLKQASQDTMTGAQLETAWRNLVNPKKAFTNNRDLSAWGYRINGNQLRMEPIICTGATVKLRGEPFLKDGIYWQSFEIIDMLKGGWRDMTLDSHWWLIQAATNSLNVPGGEIIDPFPKMSGNRMTPHFLWGLGTDIGYLPAAWFEPLPADIAKRAYPYWKSGSVSDIGRFDERTFQ